jgi:hypothetical protein
MLDATANEIRYRVRSPAKFDKGSFRYKKIKSGISIIIACPKGQYSKRSKTCRVGTQVQAVRFDKAKFTKAKAKKWVRKHGYGKKNKV